MTIPDRWTKADIERLLLQADVADLASIPIAVTDGGTPDPSWSQDVCLRLAQHGDLRVRANAVLGLGHLARVAGSLDHARCAGVIMAALRDPEPAVRGHAHSAAEDVRQYLRWPMPNYEGVVHLDAGLLTDWDSFHTVFAHALGFPDFYGRNLNAWIDCMTSIDRPDERMTLVFVEPGSTLTLHLDNVDALASSAPDIFDALIDAVAFVNFRRLALGQPAVLALAFHRTEGASRKPANTRSS
jgi:RNAse (barnase) inhibitor barstar